ncbi:hypothetical protein DFA_06353 [Cavenderia fasciculata]|uniref:Glutathione S-transferase n=1 Tax=Cavenderia fasciculata TaxID=261658 RepID=F4PKT2_CACFS|nr:uncharacterized protein DFA_06353 [Cavenderia fasciculata]EGG24206.1 hypothetical protein DFA_06353 [Cavenderia fasciculata]|eukprot:XP_004362057.1 hypothetical protein DFA_06353 [Cavenderia fasciculata]
MASKLILYGDMMSQPVRAVRFMLLNHKIPHVFKAVKIASLEHLSDEYKRMYDQSKYIYIYLSNQSIEIKLTLLNCIYCSNPLHLIPALQDGDLTLVESHTIMRYIAQKYKLDQLYSTTDLIQRCKVDMYLDWHHLGLRKASTMVFFSKFVAPRIGRAVNQAALDMEIMNLQTSLSKFESIWLGDKKFIVGDRPTLADYSAFTEISNLRFVPVEFFDLSKFPKIDAWLKRFESFDGYEESHLIFKKVLSKL